MGVAVADYDEDGRIDIVKTNFSDDVPNLYHNNGDGTFDDRVFQLRPRRLHAVRRLGRPFPRRRPRRPQGAADDERTRLPGSGAAARPALSPAEAAVLERRRRSFKDISDEARDRRSARRGPRADRPPAISTTMASLEIVISNMGARPSLLKNRDREKTGCSCSASVAKPIAMPSARASSFRRTNAGSPERFREAPASFRRTIHVCISGSASARAMRRLRCAGREAFASASLVDRPTRIRVVTQGTGEPIEDKAR